MFDSKAYQSAYQKKWAEEQRKKLDALPKVPCECGCGTMIPIRDQRGRQRRFAVHHARKRPVGKKDPPRVEKAELIYCGCGCGGQLLERNAWGNKQTHIYGHAHNKKYPHAGAPISLRTTSTKVKTVKSRERRWARKVAVLRHYSKGAPKCACCDEMELAFLALDHKGGGGGKHRRELKGKSPYAWVSEQGYPEGFQVLCHNCNMSIGLYGFCPHQGYQHTEDAKRMSGGGGGSSIMGMAGRVG
jgi:hypothetical protein